MQNVGGKEVLTGQKNFDRFITYDSAVGESLKVNFTGVENWVGVVTHIHFCLPEGSYEDQSAYLLINGNSMINSTITQLNRKPDGSLLPIMFPTDLAKMKIKAYIKGHHTGSDELKLSILDKDLKTVTVARLIVHIHVFNDRFKVLNL